MTHIKREDFDEETFLRVLSETANVVESCKAAGVKRRSVYRWRDEDPEFRKAWDDANERGTDALEDEAIRRASKGTRKPVFYKGTICGHVREYSDTLMIVMLKARRPAKFKERSAVEMTGSNGQPIAFDIRMPIDEFNKLPAGEQIKHMQQALGASRPH